MRGRKRNRLGPVLVTLLMLLAAFLLAKDILGGVMEGGALDMERFVKLIKSLRDGY